MKGVEWIYVGIVKILDNSGFTRCSDLMPLDEMVTSQGGGPMLMQNVVRMSDRFLDHKNPDAIDRQERLFSCITLVAIFYIIFSIAFMKMSELEKRHRVYHPDPQVQFELMIAPPPPKIAPILLPPAPAINDGKVDIGGGAAAAVSAATATIPTLPTNIATTKPNNVAHHIPTPIEAPVAVAPPAPVAVRPPGESELVQASTATNGSGTAVNGKANGGEGTGVGTTVGDGKEDGNAGGPIISTIETATVARGNISPYRKRMLVNLAQVWRPTKKDEMVLLSIRISSEGHLIDVEVLEASSKKAAKVAVAAVESTEFEPLPGWFKGSELTFKVHLDVTELQH